ncbi:MAG TPA: TlpA disulfide reductase family protein [Thermoanaerobaculia bacterium]|nr:TlpA disulfide reductase family protein [Thermoanaerobaculia bacterium]
MGSFELALAVCVASSVAAASDTPQSGQVERARRAIAASGEAYRAAPALTDTFTYVVQGPNMDREPKKIEIRLGPGRDASVADALLSATAVGDTFYLTKSDAPGKYVSRPFSGDFGKALVAVAGSQSSLFEPAQIALRSGRTVDACINSFRFNLLGPLRIIGFERIAGASGRPMEEIFLEADNGREEVVLDAKTHLLSSAHLRVQPPGAPSDVAVEIRGDFSPKVLTKADGVVAFDPGDRRAVSDLADLASESLPIGKPAPPFELENLQGARVALADLKGRAVVLDFWATWCVPCWKTLKETQALAEWVSSSGLPVTVLAINTMERFPTETERKSRVAEFFQSQKLTIPTLLDRGTDVFRSFGTPGLPSIVIVAPDGTILQYHQGLIPNMAETLKAEVRKAVNRG